MAFIESQDKEQNAVQGLKRFALGPEPEPRAPGHEAPLQAPSGEAEPLPSAPDQTKNVKRGFRLLKMWKWIAAAALVSVAAPYGAKVVYRMMTTESTDDAYVAAHVHAISSRISGTISEILVDENQTVKKGDLLIQLDPNDYIVAYKIAQANYGKAHQDLGRLASMRTYEPDEKPIYDQYAAAALTSEAELERARLNLDYTRIFAPSDGRIGKRNAETGQMLAPGQNVLSLVEPDQWITANFKESQAAHIRTGQVAEIRVDAIPGHVFKGTVDSVAPASGATFSLLPPDNATGNFTKIVQRIPVKIVFDAESIKGFENRISAGMSTEVTIESHGP